MFFGLSVRMCDCACVRAYVPASTFGLRHSPKTSSLIRNKKLSYRRVTARCVVSVEILPVATQQCRNYLYDKS